MLGTRYMNGAVGTQHRKDVADKPDEEGQALSGPATFIQEKSEDVGRRGMWSHIYKRNKNSEESKNMEDQDQSFQSGQKAADDRVDEDR